MPNFDEDLFSNWWFFRKEWINQKISSDAMKKKAEDEQKKRDLAEQVKIKEYFFARFYNLRV